MFVIVVKIDALRRNMGNAELPFCLCFRPHVSPSVCELLGDSIGFSELFHEVGCQ